MNCEFCEKEFKTKYSLNTHKNKAKYCLILQKKIEPKEESFKCNICKKILSSKRNLEIHKRKCEGKREKIEEFKCEFCNKILSSKQNLEIHIKKCETIEEKEEFKCEFCNKILSSKHSLIYHLDTCDKKKEKEEKIKKENMNIELKKLKEKLESKDKELKEKDELFIKIKTQNENYEKQENIYKEQIINLQDKLEKLARKAIERPTTTNNTTNNHLNITTSMDFSDLNKLKYIIDNNLNINHIVEGQKGIANFVKETMLTDENGNLKYICTDPSRNIFKYKDTNGEIKKDIEAKKLTTYIIDSGIKKKSAEIANGWCIDNEGDIDMTKYDIMSEPQQSILKFGDDNNSFKRELASITTI
jgi:hypothetical protein